MSNDYEIFKGKSLASLFQDIYENQNYNRNQLDVLTKNITAMIKDGDTAVQIIPMMKEYLEINVRNDELLIKLASIVQKIMTAEGKGESESEFGLSFLAEVDTVVDFLGFSVGHGDVVQRVDGAVDCNMMVLIPEDRVRALRLLGEDREADHMASSILMSNQMNEEDEEEEDMTMEFPYSCPEEMPLVCRLCHAGERADDGKCPNCGHVGGSDWKKV